MRGRASGGDVVLPDETTFVIPGAWRRSIHPRHGGPTTAAHRADPAAVAKLRQRVTDQSAAIEQVLADQRSDSGLATAGRAFLQGSASPLGAAVVATALTTVSNHVDLPESFADAWLTEHGLVFAAEATAELARVFVNHYIDNNTTRVSPHVTVRAPAAYLPWSWEGEPVARRTRALLAAADSQDYQEVLAALAACRRDLFQRVVTAYLAPTRADWVDECLDREWSGFALRLVLCSLGSTEQLDRIKSHPIGIHLWDLTDSGELLYTLVDGVGPGVAATLARSLYLGSVGGARRKRVLTVLAALPTDEAFELMLARLAQPEVRSAVRTAMARFPVRALRLLARAASDETGPAAQLLGEHVLAQPELTAAVLPSLTDDERARVEAVRRATGRIADAPAESLPRLLISPPWTGKRTTAKPVVVNGLTPGAEQDIVWAPGQREQWAQTVRVDSAGWGANPDWDALVQRYRDGNLWVTSEPGLFIDGPEQLVRPLLADWRPQRLWYADRWMKNIIARHELAALPVALRVATANPALGGECLLPFVDLAVARLMADWLVRLKSARETALAWLAAHAAAAARLLVPDALGKAGAQRRAAEAALRSLAERGHRDDVLTAAQAHGEQAALAVQSTLDVDPLAVLPAKPPSVGAWVDPAGLPQLLCQGRAHALPAESVRHVVTMLAMSTPGQWYPGLDVVRQACDADSLVQFCWGLFDRWRSVGMPAKDNWVLTALGWLGGDDVVHRLAPLIRTWPGTGGHARAVLGLDVLAAIGTDLALRQLHDIAQKATFKGLKAKAQEKVAAVAAGLGLSAEQLADRLVPDFGLAADGSLTLDYGPRRFTVGFDEQLKPWVADENGKRRKDLPRPGVRDDQDLAPAAHKRFAALKKEVRTVAADQIRRLEHAMVTQRRWTLPEFHDLFVHHPLVWHIARRLVWLAERDGSVVATFRLAEDRTLADVGDEHLSLPDGTLVGIAHPLHLAGSLADWATLFTDYEMVQPFAQLARTVHTLSAAERGSTELTRFHGATVPVGRVLGLQRRGWQRGVPQDNGVEPWILRPIPGGRAVVVNLDPGIAAGMPHEFPEQRIESVWINTRVDGDWRRPDASPCFGELDPVTAAEVLAELTDLCSA